MLDHVQVNHSVDGTMKILILKVLILNIKGRKEQALKNTYLIKSGHEKKVEIERKLLTKFKTYVARIPCPLC